MIRQTFGLRVFPSGCKLSHIDLKSTFFIRFCDFAFFCCSCFGGVASLLFGIKRLVLFPSNYYIIICTITVCFLNRFFLDENTPVDRSLPLPAKLYIRQLYIYLQYTVYHPDKYLASFSPSSVSFVISSWKQICSNKESKSHPKKVDSMFWNEFFWALYLPSFWKLQLFIGWILFTTIISRSLLCRVL